MEFLTGFGFVGLMFLVGGVTLFDGGRRMERDPETDKYRTIMMLCGGLMVVGGLIIMLVSGLT